MKKKAMIMAVASLGSMALIGTGFAGWVISANATTSASGVVTAFDVADHRLVVESGTWDKKNADGNGEIIFGTNNATGLAHDWFSFTGEDGKTEQLKIVYTFTVKSKDAGDAGKFTVAQQMGENKFKLTAGADNWTNAKNLGLVAAEPKVEFDTPEGGAYTLAAAGTTVNMTVTFKWGSHFGDKNPLEFYNNGDTDGSTSMPAESRPESKKTEDPYTWADDALFCIKELLKVNKVGFTLGVDVARQQ